MQEYVITVTMDGRNAFITPQEPGEDREAYSTRVVRDEVAAASCTVFYRRGELTEEAIEQTAHMYLARVVNQQ